METIDVEFTRLRDAAIPPARATEGSAGYDLSACLDAPMTVAPGERALVPTGLRVALPHSGAAAFVFARSGMALKRGLAMANGVGVIDSDYRGELCVPVINLSGEPCEIRHGDRVAQMCLIPVYAARFAETGALSDTERGAGGFGSTG
ncbi:MAG: dUTP diphosphatase [Oscillospiraceae bacterium]|nr:dUTP diphosphatase [Oscillospiraceae bacterium]